MSGCKPKREVLRALVSSVVRNADELDSSMRQAACDHNLHPGFQLQHIARQGIRIGIDGARPFRVSPDSPVVRAAADTLARIFGMPPDFVGMHRPHHGNFSRGARRRYTVLLLQHR